MSDEQVTVVIVGWNAAALLPECLGRLRAQTVAPARVLVIDNGSSDDSQAVVERYPEVEWIGLGRNLGFAAANNIALERTTTPWVALLNPDAFVAPDWLESLLRAARRNPEHAAFGSTQRVYGHPEVMDGLGDVMHCTGLVWRRGHGVRMTVEADTEVFSTCAAAALYRTDAVREVGGFDVDFFCYLEDVDLGFRLRLRGYRAMQVVDAVVEHVGSATTGGRRSDFSVYHGQRNMVWNFAKNMPAALLAACFLPHLMVNLVLIVRFSLAGQSGTVWRAKRDALAGLPGIWRKRAAIQASRRLSTRGVWQVLAHGIPTRRR
jgi:GT2 family glycosyltransferase